MTKEKNIDNIRVGIDIGSTTVKLVIVDITKNKIIYSKYKRHNAYQEKTLLELLEKCIVHPWISILHNFPLAIHHFSCATCLNVE